MPEGVKPTNWKGNKNSGRKSNAEYVKNFKEELKQEALAEIATRVIGRRLKMLDDAKGEEIKYIGIEKDFALPIALKGMVEKKDITSMGEKITNTVEIDNLTNILNDIYKGTSKPSDGEPSSTLDDKASDKE